MSKIQKLELTWVGKNEQEEIEPRILVENPELSHIYETAANGQVKMINDDGTFDNMLIHGDNLLALKALEQDFAGQVKCIYIDPPFNTGAAFEHYDDNQEHSIWLDLMYKRIKILHSLLKDDGVILIEIDDNEMPYLRVILDEVFGRNSFVAQINVKSNNISGTKTAHKTKTVLRNKDNIIVYKKGEEIFVNPQYIERNRWDTHYNSYGVFNNGKLVEIKKFKDVLIENNIITNKQTVKEDLLNNASFYDFIIKHKNNICRLVNSMPDEIKKLSKQSPEEIIEYKDENEITRYAYNGSRVSFLNSSIMEIDGEEKFVQLLGDLWVDIDFQNTQNEGKVSFPASKKPEALIRRILDMFTQKGEIVLDSFLGSGTTCAVAHKMGRKWIGIELGDHAYTHCKVRLDAIINNEDPSGISKAINWQGGGSYRFYELAPSLVVKDKYGKEIINPEYNANMLAAAMAKHEGFKYSPDKENAYKQGFASEKSFIFTTTTHLTAEYLDEIATHFADDEFLVINCKSFDGNISNNYKNIKIKKIPQSILGKCVFGKDNYNLNIINLPTEEGADEEK